MFVLKNEDWGESRKSNDPATVRKSSGEGFTYLEFQDVCTHTADALCALEGKNGDAWSTGESNRTI